MRRLGFFLIAIALAVQCASTFSSPAYAQSADRIVERQQGNYDYFLGIVTAHHNEAMAAFDAIAKASTSSPASQNATRDYKIVAERNFNAYTAAFNAEKARAGTTPADSQIKGIQAWVASRDTGANLALTRAYAGPQKTAYDQYSIKVSRDALLAAEQIKRGVITAGSAEDRVQTATGTITNAAAGNKNQTTQPGDPSPDACSLLSGNLIGCIDLLVAKIVKGVLLSIAGFLAWLAANLLNISIQVSILDFKDWSPPTLYPTWVVIRQIVSLVVVFAGLYLGFMYIIGRQDTFAKFVGWLCIFALFVNFSYPVTRALVDVSNIVALNVYSSTFGGDALSSNFGNDLTTAGKNTAGAIIVSKLGIQGLLSAVTETGAGAGRSMMAQINSTPGALIAVIFVLYAAYVLFMATAIIVARAVVLSFLIVASPLLLVDAVIPGLGTVAMKMRKMFFEQLIVAPVFMLMLALTLKFMDVFQTSTGPLAPSADGVMLFFNFIMMIVMLHITLKVTRSVAGEAGQLATNVMGKVGGFGLGVASGGAGLLARGSVGMAAARMRDSGWMDKMQGSRMGRGLYGLSNSLAQSTFDTRNIGMVNRGMATAGMGMGQGLKQNYDQRFAEKDTAMKKKYSSIKDGDAREGYLAQKTGSLGSYGQRGLLLNTAQSDAQKTAASIKENEGDQLKKYGRIVDEDKKREYYDSLPKNLRDKIDAQNAPLNTKTPEGTKPAPTQTVDENMSMETPEQAESRVRGQQTGPATQASGQGVNDVKSQSFEERAAEKRKTKQAEAMKNVNKGPGSPPGTPGTSGAAASPAQPKPQTPSPAAATATI